jgi:alkylation response protein AidB-like acyl-CoA dehydrogenase
MKDRSNSHSDKASAEAACLPPVSAIRAAANELGPLIREAADEIERERRLPERVTRAMKEAGVFGMAMPNTWGGAELELPEQLRVIEALARLDGSVGWCALIGSAGGFMSSWLDDDAARGLFKDVNASTAGSIFFAGKAVEAEGGYRVSGRWPFVSGCQHSAIIVLTCHVFDRDDKPIFRSTGLHETRLVYVAGSKAKVLDTWYSTGLRGSGSHDVEMSDVFVPDRCAVSFPDLHSCRPRPLYAHPFAFAYLFPGVAIGIARAAIDAFIDVASHREITIAALGGQRVLLRMSPHAQIAISQAQGLIGSARSLVLEILGEIWSILTHDAVPSLSLRANYLVAMTHAHRSCTEAVDILYKTNGGSSVYAHCPLERCFRDIHTINQHHLASLAFDEKAGQVLLGLEPFDQLF